ncbi:MAG: hypothetical protein H6671_16620 [Anaerolineaceae bacterium]|nr:hypothetical protein [Anaerolineaceae bacterium]
MNARQRYILFFLVTCLWVGSGLAQESASCPAIVSDALAVVDSLCGETGRNQACYGNFTLMVEAQEGVDNLTFDTPGDMVNVADIQSLRLTGMDEALPEWGVALMKLQANLPDTLPGQNVTMLLIGDIDLRNATAEGYSPLQAFYFSSGMGDSQCAEAPESGILIQTPKGQGQIAFRVNNVDIALGSTAFLQAAAGDALYVNLLEGQATVTAFDEAQTVLAGEMLSVPLDANLDASGPPTAPSPYAEENIKRVAGMIDSLPVTVQTNTIETAVNPPPESTHGAYPTFDASACPYEPGKVYELEANQAYTVSTWPGCWITIADAQASKAEVSIAVTVDGVPAGTFAGFGPVGHCAPADGGYNFQANFQIAPLSPGMHTIQVVHDHPGGRIYTPDGSSDAWTWVETCTIQAE